jgi:hypothetical protein
MRSLNELSNYSDQDTKVRKCKPWGNSLIIFGVLGFIGSIIQLLSVHTSWAALGLGFADDVLMLVTGILSVYYAGHPSRGVAIATFVFSAITLIWTVVQVNIHIDIHIQTETRL